MKTRILLATEIFLTSDENKRREERMRCWCRHQINGNKMKNTSAEGAVEL